MDEEMDDNSVEYTFTVIEVDLDYEFDAARYFDFCREESLAESREAELWFLTAPSYSASPFAAKFIPDGVLLQNVNTSPKPKPEENVDMSETSSDIEVDEEVAIGNEGKEVQKRGISTSLYDKNIWTFKSQTKPSGTSYKSLMNDRLNYINKSSKKPYGSKTSTLMKPTASLLAKQNQPSQTSDRFQKVLGGKIDKSSSNSCVAEVQAAKRQKLEGGHLHKVGETKQQLNFMHKLPKKDGNGDGSSVHAKLTLTIPKQPALETAHRAQRMKPKTGGEMEHSTTVRRFRALPLNRKILEAPSLSLPKRSTPRVPTFQEFHLKTSERAIQHCSAIPTGPVSSSNNSKELQTSSTSAAMGTEAESRRSIVPADTSKLEGSEMSYRFRALPLNKKILSSKGDIGMFRNNKRDITVPMEFNFRTDRRMQYNPPPTDLFNKLSLNSGTQSNTVTKLKLQQTSTLKGSKENRWDSLQHNNEVKHDAKWKLPWNGGNNGRITDVLV